jgi:hypothetical protein
MDHSETGACCDDDPGKSVAGILVSERISSGVSAVGTTVFAGHDGSRCCR